MVVYSSRCATCGMEGTWSRIAQHVTLHSIAGDPHQAEEPPRTGAYYQGRIEGLIDYCKREGILEVPVKYLETLL